MKDAISPGSKNPTAYEPGLQERRAMEAHRARKKWATPAPRVAVVETDVATEIRPDHPDPVYGQVSLLRALGTTSEDFLGGILRQLAKLATRDQKVDQCALNAMLSIINGISPKDETEAMLATQMAAVHLATMTLARRLDCVENIQ